MEDEVVSEVNLRDFIVMIQRRWWVCVATLVVCVAAAAVYTARAPRIYEASSQIELKPPAANATAAFPFPYLDNGTYKQTQLALLGNADFLNLVKANLEAQKKFASTERLHYSISTSDRRGTDLIDITVTSGDPEVAQAAADEVGHSFAIYRRKVDEESAQQDLSTMETRVRSAQKAVRDASGALADFQARYHVGDLPKQVEGSMSRLASLQSEASQARRDLNLGQITIAGLQQQLTAQNHQIRTEGERNDAYIEELRLELSAEKTRLDDISRTFVTYPALTDPLKAEIAQTNQRLQAELAKVYTGAVTLPAEAQVQAALQSAQAKAVLDNARYNLLQKDIASISASLSSVPSREREYWQLTQNVSVAQDLDRETLAQYQKLDMDTIAHPNQVAITQTAQLPGRPILPRPTQNLITGLVFGLILGLGLALLLDHLDDSVHSEEDLRKLAPDLPVLGVLPSIPGNELEAVNSMSARSRGPYRLLWTNIGFSALDRPIRTLVVTSAVSGEGKSLTCAYLARSAAEEGKRVILVDSDLRRPNQYRIFGLPDTLGICDVITGKGTLDEALSPTDQPNLMVLTAGKTLPLNPAVLIKSERLDELIEEMLQRADIVIFDTPPALAITDALLLASRVDAVLEITEAGRGKRAHIQKVIEAVGRARAHHIGLVLNKVRKGLFGNYGYYYYYYYHQDRDGDGNGKAVGRSNGKSRRTIEAQESTEDRS